MTDLVRCPKCFCPVAGNALGKSGGKLEKDGYCVNCGAALDGSDRKLNFDEMWAYKFSGE